jgi:hypothetical protein
VSVHLAAERLYVKRLHCSHCNVALLSGCVPKPA